MTESSGQKPLEGLSFLDKIGKYDEPKDKQKQEEEMIGKSSNRTLDEKWNIKIQIDVKFFVPLFNFIKEMGYNTVFGLTSRQIKIYKIAPDNAHLTYVTIDKTEVSEYINTDFPLNTDITQEQSSTPETETIVYPELDIIEEMNLNEKYPLDIYFDTKEKNTMYLINNKDKESRRLNDISNSDTSISSYGNYFQKVINFMKDENVQMVTLNHASFSNVLSTLVLKKSKKDKSSSGILDIKFTPSDIEFLTGNEIKNSSLQLYGDDIALRVNREVNIKINLDYLVKFRKLEFQNNINLYVNKSKPLVLESRFGAGKIRIYYLIAPRETAE